MRKVLSSLIFMISFFIFISNSEASCTYKRISDLKKIASNVNITYTYTIVDNKASFDIRFANLTNDIYLYDSFNDKKYNVEGEVILKNYIDGVKYRFFINSNDKDCKDEQLVTRYVTLPKYNIYYGDPICNGIEDYTLCQKWGSFNINNYDAYQLQIEKYKASLIKKEKNTKTEETTKINEKFVDFFLKYYAFIFTGIIVICLIIIFYLHRKDRFDF